MMFETQAYDIREYRPSGLDAELIGDEPQWYIVVTAPNHERIAAMYLAGGFGEEEIKGRGFGVYLPEIDKAIPASRGRPARIEKRPLFPGYLFVHVWDIATHMWRIRSIPGVTNLLYSCGEPATIPWNLIYIIKAVEQKQMNLRKSRRARWRKHRLEDDPERGDEWVVIRPYNALREWESIETLDDDDRNSLLSKALGLA